MQFSIVFTSEYIYGIYAKVPDTACNEAPTGFIDAFVLAANTNYGCPEKKAVDVSIEIDRKCEKVVYRVDGAALFDVTQIGLPLPEQYRLVNYGGVNKVVKIKTVRGGFGTFDFLDCALPNNYAREYVQQSDNATFSQLVSLGPITNYLQNFATKAGLFTVPLSFAIATDELEYRLFGQGAELHIDKFVLTDFASS
jgi:hypothetical protein